jgi:LPXTG-motif cell wall-anchored protein
MNTRAKIFAAAFALAAAAGVNAQSSIDKSFTANGTTCADVNWAPEMLAKHPKIGDACQEVMQRNGTTYVKFQGEVKKVAKGGSEITMGMKGSDTKLVLNPDPNRTVNIGGKKTPVKSLRPGDELTFYVPETRVVAAVMDTPDAPVEEIPIGPPVVEQMAMTTTTYEDLPKTASSWPLAGLLGALCIGLALVMRTRRVLGR